MMGCSSAGFVPVEEGEVLEFLVKLGPPFDRSVVGYFDFGFLPRPSLPMFLASDQRFVAHLTDRSAGPVDPKRDA